MTRVQKKYSRTQSLTSAWIPRGPPPSGNNPAYVNLLVTYAGGLSVVVDSTTANNYVLQSSNTALHMWENPGQSGFAVPSTSITVVNNGNLTEKWELDASTTAGLGNWTLHNSSNSTRVNGTNPVNEYGCTTYCPGANEYGVQALFVSSNTAGGLYGQAAGNCPAVNAAVWDTVLDTVPVKQGFTPGALEAAGVAVYTSAYFANSAVISGASGNPDVTSGVSNGDMYSYYAVAGSGQGQRGLCLRVTMPNTATTQSQQTITVEITAIPGT